MVWERTLRYSFGGDSVSSAIVTGPFLLRLGLGAFVFRHWRQRAFTVLAVVELGIGAYAIAGYHVLAPLARILAGLSSGSVFEAAGVRPVVLNTLGPAAGALATPFVLVNRVSLPVTLTVVGIGNLVLAAVVWLCGRDGAPRTEEAADEEEAPHRYALPALAFVSGVVSLGFAVSLFRAFFTLNPSSPYNVPFVLTTFLLAMALGSALSTRFERYTAERSLPRVGRLFVGAVLCMMAGIIVSSSLLGLDLFTSKRARSPGPPGKPATGPARRCVQADGPVASLE